VAGLLAERSPDSTALSPFICHWSIEHVALRRHCSFHDGALVSSHGVQAMSESGASLMSDIFRPYEKLVEITIMGKTFLVPERNSLLRAFQFISPETIPYGRFCWNQECQYCKVNCQLSDDDQSRPILSCKFLVSEGMTISDLAPELIGCLRTKLGAAANAGSSNTENNNPTA
jgi:hypothetical protein